MIYRSMKVKKFICVFLFLCATFFFAHNVSAVPIVGSSSGVFINPTGPPGMVTTGVGTDSFAWGVPCDGVTNCFTSPGGITPPSSLSFAGASFSTSTETEFKVGDLSFFNGTLFPGTQADAVVLDISLAFTTPTGLNETLLFDLVLVNTPNTGDPIASADSVFLPSTFPTSTFNVAGIEHTLAITFGDTTGGGFSETDQLFALESQTVTGEIRGSITADLPNQPIPVPTTIALLGIGLAGLAGAKVRRRRKKKEVDKG